MSARAPDRSRHSPIRPVRDALPNDWIVPAWPAPANVQAFFTTRNAVTADGVRTAAFDVGGPPRASDDATARAAIADHRRFLQQLLPSPPVWLDQAHGTDVVAVDRAPGSPDDRWRRADGSVTRAPDVVHECDTRADQAFIYALSGDRNPLHRDPKVAKMAGFPKPILHGLCSYGTACRAVISTICKYDPTKITSFDVRFSSPVFPGETIITEMWVDGNVVSYRSRLKERDVVVLNNGKCTIAN